jgi:hypothetical protein
VAEGPSLLVLLSEPSTAAHWSVLGGAQHYLPSDILMGATIGYVTGTYLGER